MSHLTNDRFACDQLHKYWKQHSQNSAVQLPAMHTSSALPSMHYWHGQSCYLPEKRRYNQCGTIKISQLCDENAEKPEQCGVISYGLLSLVQKWWPPSNFGSKGMKLQFLGKLCQDMSSSSSYLILGMGATITHTRLTALFPGLHRWAGTRKLKPIWILLKPQERIYSLVLRWLQCEVYRIIETSVQYPG